MHCIPMLSLWQRKLQLVSEIDLWFYQSSGNGYCLQTFWPWLGLGILPGFRHDADLNAVWKSWQCYRIHRLLHAEGRVVQLGTLVLQWKLCSVHPSCVRTSTEHGTRALRSSKPHSDGSDCRG